MTKERDEGNEGKPPSKNIKRQCVPASLKDSRFPQPSLQGSNSFFPDLNLPHMPVPVRPLNSGKYGIWKEKGLGRGGEHIPERAGLPFVSLYSPLFKDTRWPLQWCVWEVGGRLEQESCFYGSLNTRVHSCLISACSLMEGRKRRGHNEWNRCASSMQWMASKKVWGEACFSRNYWDGFHTSPLRQNVIKKTANHSFYCVFLFWIFCGVLTRHLNQWGYSYWSHAFLLCNLMTFDLMIMPSDIILDVLILKCIKHLTSWIHKCMNLSNVHF